MSEFNVLRARAPRILKLQKPRPRKISSTGDAQSKVDHVMSDIFQSVASHNNYQDDKDLSASLLLEERAESRRPLVTLSNGVDYEKRVDSERDISDTAREIVVKLNKADENGNNSGTPDNRMKARRGQKLTKPRPLRTSVSAVSDPQDKEDIESQMLAFIDKLPKHTVSLAEMVAFRNMLMKNKVVLHNVGCDTISLCYCIIQEALKLETNEKKVHLMTEILSCHSDDQTEQQDTQQVELSVNNKEKHTTKPISYLDEDWRLGKVDINDNDTKCCTPCLREEFISKKRYIPHHPNHVDINQNVPYGGWMIAVNGTVQPSERVADENDRNKCVKQTQIPTECLTGDSQHRNMQGVMPTSDSNVREVCTRKCGFKTNGELHIRVSTPVGYVRGQRNDINISQPGQNEVQDRKSQYDLVQTYHSQESHDSGIGDDVVLWDTEESVQEDWSETIKSGVHDQIFVKVNGEINPSTSRTDSSHNVRESTQLSKPEAGSISWAKWKVDSSSPVCLNDNGTWTKWRHRSDSFSSNETPMNSSRRGSLESSDSMTDTSKNGVKNQGVPKIVNIADKGRTGCGCGVQSITQSCNTEVQRFGNDVKSMTVLNDTVVETAERKLSLARNTNDKTFEASSLIQCNVVEELAVDNPAMSKEVLSKMNSAPKPSAGFGTPSKPNLKKPERQTSWKGQSSDGVVNWRDMCQMKPKFLERQSCLPSLKHELIREPLGPGSSATLVAEVEKTMPAGAFTAKGRRSMFNKYQQAMFDQSETDLVQISVVYSRHELLMLAHSHLSKTVPAEFSYLSKIYPSICLMEMTANY